MVYEEGLDRPVLHQNTKINSKRKLQLVELTQSIPVVDNVNEFIIKCSAIIANLLSLSGYLAATGVNGLKQTYTEMDRFLFPNNTKGHVCTTIMNILKTLIS